MNGEKENGERYFVLIPNVQNMKNIKKLDIKLRFLIISTETIRLSFLNSQHLIMFEEIFHELGMIPSEINDSLK